jgi:tRNA 5-methylaminomethyl-2-thiouridine biosynthesis bifunctional protein
MVSLLQPAQLCLDADGTPVSEVYGDVYHSAAGAHAQARHVFLAGNDLPARWRGRGRFSILETGFGLGLNFMATWLAWQGDPSRCDVLEFISFEKHPFVAEDLAAAHAGWSEFAQLACRLHQVWPMPVAGEHRLEFDGGRVILRLVFGDAVEVLPVFDARVDATIDAIYLDGFSPARNPELWSPALCADLARLAAPGATLATWSVAGHVRRTLAAAGFVVERRPGFAGKRQMLVGHKM